MGHGSGWNIDLKHCPFCGGRACVSMGFSTDGTSEHISYSIVCTACNVGIFRPRYDINEWSAYASVEEAAEEWNRRPGPKRIRTPEDRRPPMQTREE